MGNMKNTRNSWLLSPSMLRRNGGAVVSIVSALLVAGEAGEGLPAPAGPLGGLRPILVPATTARLAYPYCHSTYYSETAWRVHRILSCKDGSGGEVNSELQWKHTRRSALCTRLCFNVLSEACGYCETIMQSRACQKVCDKEQNQSCNHICSYYKIDQRSRYYGAYPR